MSTSAPDQITQRRILCVGMCVLDIIHVCEQFPEEDSDKRCLSGYWQRGGNASNISTVLRNLNADCEFLGMLSESPAFGFLLEDQRKRGIKISNCPTTTQDPPFSSVILVNEKDSRTIVHSNSNFPIVTYAHFSKLNLANYTWIHFEARNPSETLLMLKDIHAFNASAVVDPLGAGDMFCAATIYNLHYCNKNLKDAVDFGSICAGYKIEHRGYDDIKHFNMPEEYPPLK